MLSRENLEGGRVGIHLRKQTFSSPSLQLPPPPLPPVIYRMSEEISTTYIHTYIPIEAFKGSSDGHGDGKNAKRAQQKHNFPRWRSEECSRNEWSVLFLVFHWRYSARQIECLFSEKQTETKYPLLVRECSERALTKSKRQIYTIYTYSIYFFFSFRYCYRDIF